MRCTVLLLTLCLWGTGAWAQNDICFRVDMRDALDRELFLPLDGDRVILRGTFSGWVGNDLELRDVDWEWQPEPENAPFGNRRLTMTGNAQNVGRGEFTIDRYDLAAVHMPVLFSRDELLSDFDWLRRRLEDSHCCLHAWTPEAEFDALFEQQRALITGPMQPHEFFRIVETVTGSVGCGHTSPWMSAAYWSFADGKLFPLTFRFMDGYAVVTGYHGPEQQIEKGSIILEINGRPMKEITEELALHYSADAFNRAFRDSQVERRFSMLYARHFGFPPGFRVSCALPGRKTSVVVDLTPATVADVRADIFPPPEVTLTLYEDMSAARLAVNSFSFYDREPWFRGMIDSCLEVIEAEGLRTLILDLRGNDGGDPFCAAHLFAALAPRPLPYFAEPYGKYADLASPLPLPERRFTGQLLTLIDGRCFSTNGHFCALLKYHHIGRFLGSEGGGTYTCNAGSTEVHLPSTRIMVYIPRGSFAAAVENMDPARGIMPDVELRQRYRDYRSGTDTVLDEALRLAADHAAR